jgi:hypothetical protein
MPIFPAEPSARTVQSVRVAVLRRLGLRVKKIKCLLTAAAVCQILFCSSGFAADIAGDNAESYTALGAINGKAGNTVASPGFAGPWIQGVGLGQAAVIDVSPLAGSRSFYLGSIPDEPELVYREINPPNANPGGWTGKGNNLITFSFAIRFGANSSDTGFNVKTAPNASPTSTTLAENALVTMNLKSGDATALLFSAGGSGGTSREIDLGDTSLVGQTLNINLTVNTQNGQYRGDARIGSGAVTAFTGGQVGGGTTNFIPDFVAFGANGQGFDFDNLVVSSVPEPMTVASVGLIGGWVLRRRSNRAMAID